MKKTVVVLLIGMLLVMSCKETEARRPISYATGTYKKAMIEKNIKLVAQEEKIIDSIMKINPSAKIVYLGDLNDHPQDKAPQIIQPASSVISPKEVHSRGVANNDSIVFPTARFFVAQDLDFFPTRKWAVGGGRWMAR